MYRVDGGTDRSPSSRAITPPLQAPSVARQSIGWLVFHVKHRPNASPGETGVAAPTPFSEIPSP